MTSSNYNLKRPNSKRSVKSANTSSEYGRNLYTPRRKSALKQRKVRLNSEEMFLNSSFFCRIKYMENENLVALVAAMITCFSIHRLDGWTWNDLDDIGRCETCLTLVHGIVTLNIVIIGSCIAAIIFLLNRRDFSVLSAMQKSYSGTTLESFDLHRRKTKCMRKWMVRMVAAIALFYVSSFCINPILWCDDSRVVGIFASGFVLLGFFIFVIVYCCVRKLPDDRGSSGCSNKGMRNAKKTGYKELISSDVDTLSWSKDSIARNTFVSERPHYKFNELRCANPNISWKNMDRMHRRLAIEEKVHQGKDLERQSWVLLSNGLKKGTQPTHTQCKPKWSSKQGTGSSTPGPERIRKKRARRGEEKMHRYSEIGRRDSCTIIPQQRRSNSSPKKPSIKRRKYYPEELHNSENSKFKESDKIDSKPKILTKLYRDDQDGPGLENIRAACSIKESWSKKRDSRQMHSGDTLCPVKSDHRIVQSPGDNMFWFPSSGGNGDSEDSKSSELQHVKTSYKKTRNDGATMVVQDVVKGLEQNANSARDMNDNPSTLSPGRSTKYGCMSKESQNSISDLSLVSQKKKQHVNRKNSKIFKQSIYEEIEEFEMTSSSGTIGADSENVIKMRNESHQQTVPSGELKSTGSDLLINSDRKDKHGQEKNQTEPKIKVSHISSKCREGLEEGYERSGNIGSLSRRLGYNGIGKSGTTSVGHETGSESKAESMDEKPGVHYSFATHSDIKSVSTGQNQRPQLESNCAQVNVDTSSDHLDKKYSEKEKGASGVDVDAFANGMVDFKKVAANVKYSSAPLRREHALTPGLELPVRNVSHAALKSELN